jgi:hypothetical protein
LIVNVPVTSCDQSSAISRQSSALSVLTPAGPDLASSTFRLVDVSPRPSLFAILNSLSAVSRGEPAIRNLQYTIRFTDNHQD